MKLAGGLLRLVASAAAAHWPGDQEIPAVDYPRLPEEAPVPRGFVPPGWKMEARAVGDLNGDRLPDAALVLHMDSPRNRIHPSFDETITYDTNPRMMVVALARPGGGFELAGFDRTLIPRLENPNQDEPFDSVKIAGGVLKVKMHLFLSAGGWEMGDTTYTFRWIDSAFRMIGFDRDVVMRNSGETEKTSINYLTGRKLVKTGHLDGREGMDRSIKLPKKPLLALGEIGDGLYFEPGEH